MGKLDGKTAIITGGGTGIGEIAALKFAAEGAHVVVTGRRSGPLDETVAAIEAAGGSAAARAMDMENEADVRSLASWVTDQYGAVDILVNNAGHSTRARSLRYVSREEWDSVFAVNLTGVYLLCQALLPGMIERGEGTIITVSSTAAIRPGLLGGAAYGAAKAGVFNLMGDLNAEFGGQGIRACTVIPAEVNTPILVNRPRPPTEAERATMMGPSDVAEVILLCATLPQRTLVEQVILSPTIKRDLTADLEVSRRAGAPD